MAHVCYAPRTGIGSAGSNKTPAHGRGSAKEGLVGLALIKFSQ